MRFLIVGFLLMVALAALSLSSVLPCSQTRGRKVQPRKPEEGHEHRVATPHFIWHAGLYLLTIKSEF